MRSLIVALYFLVIFLPAISDGSEAQTGTLGRASSILQAQSFLFIRLPGPRVLGMSLGHLAFGFEVRELEDGRVQSVKYYAGSIENQSHMPWLRRGDDNDAWGSVFETPEEMFGVMRDLTYTHFKFTEEYFEVGAARMVQAVDVIAQFPFRGYRVSGNNCLNAVYDVLQVLGAPSLVHPDRNWIPSRWYEQVDVGWSESYEL